MTLIVQGLYFKYGKRPVLEDISFQAHKGEILAILGKNGTGKTTLLKCINRILTPYKGDVFVDGRSISQLSRTDLARNIGYIEQKHTATHTTVFDSVLLGRKPYVLWDITAKDMQIASQALEMLGLGAYAMRFTDELSGGELQKVAVARALAQEPGVLLMDEPTSNLDLKNQLEVLKTIRNIARQKQIAVAVVMHDLNMALRYADRFVLLKDRRLFQCGKIDDLTSESIEAVYSVPVELVSCQSQRVVVPL